MSAPAPPPTGTLPAYPPARLPLLDILRGVALPGIALMNIEWFTRAPMEIGSGVPADATGADFVAGWLVFVLVQGKFWLLFSLLFGAGFTLMRQRLLAGGRPFHAPYLRRVAVLFVIGIAHALLLWFGDILHAYAIAALLMLALMPLTERDPVVAPLLRALLGAALFLTFTGWLSLVTVVFLFVPADVLRDQAAIDAGAAAFAAAREQAIAAYSQGGWLEVTAQRGRDFVDTLDADIFTIPVALGVFLMGSWLLDSGRLARPQEFLRFHRLSAWLLLPLGGAITIAGSWRSTGAPPGQTDAAAMVSQWTHWVGAPLMTLGYVGIVVLLARRPRPGAFLQRWIAPAGRMALTNYLMVSAICGTLFYGYGFGLWGQVSRPGQVGLVAAITVLQCLLSAWWLARFRYGPMEWLWRAATWLQWPPMRRGEG